MRPSALFPFLCALVALILSLLCLFAGSTRSFLQNAEMLTLNTSRIGHVPGFRFNATDGHSGGFFSNLLNDLENDIDGLLNDVTSDIARAFHIHDFYSVHLMTYCEGYYEPNSTVSNPSENVTQCSNRTAGFFFDPGSIIQKELADNITLADINWPPEIDKAAKDVKVASKATFVFYCIGIGFTGLAFLASAVGVITNGRFSVVANWTLAIVRSPTPHSSLNRLHEMLTSSCAAGLPHSGHCLGNRNRGHREIRARDQQVRRRHRHRGVQGQYLPGHDMGRYVSHVTREPMVDHRVRTQPEEPTTALGEGNPMVIDDEGTELRRLCSRRSSIRALRASPFFEEKHD